MRESGQFTGWGLAMRRAAPRQGVAGATLLAA
jgi:hypothetical protein